MSLIVIAPTSCSAGSQPDARALQPILDEGNALFEIRDIHHDHSPSEMVSVHANGRLKIGRTLVRLGAGGQSGSALIAVHESTVGARLSGARGLSCSARRRANPAFSIGAYNRPYRKGTAPPSAWTQAVHGRHCGRPPRRPDRRRGIVPHQPRACPRRKSLRPQRSTPRTRNNALVSRLVSPPAIAESWS